MTWWQSLYWPAGTQLVWASGVKLWAESVSTRRVVHLRPWLFPTVPKGCPRLKSRNLLQMRERYQRRQIKTNPERVRIAIFPAKIEFVVRARASCRNLAFGHFPGLILGRGRSPMLSSSPKYNDIGLRNLFLYPRKLSRVVRGRTTLR
jgi:hypothetical protein